MLPDDICPRPDDLPPVPAPPMAAPIFLSSVYRCADPDQADRLLSGEEPGFVYIRDGHPNASLLAEKCRELQGAEQAVVTASGMGALAVAVLSQLAAGDQLVVSRFLYGKSLALLAAETTRLGIACEVVDSGNLSAVAEAMTDRTKLVVVETIANPLLQVADIAALADVAHRRGAKLLVDNTFACPIVCRPISLGADLVMESLTKIISGHSDVMLGLLCGSAAVWERVPTALSTWGLAAAPFDCYLALRGLATLALRAERASANALAAAKFLSRQPAVQTVHYPGLASHPDYPLAVRQFGRRFGAMVTMTLAGGRSAAAEFIKSARRIPFCPSLGELSTTLSHPESTSHRGLSPEDRAALGISGGTIRLSIGIESSEFVVDALSEGLCKVGSRRSEVGSPDIDAHFSTSDFRPPTSDLV